MSRWEVYLNKQVGDGVVSSFKNKKEAIEEQKYRDDLLKVFDKGSEVRYNIREVKN